MLGKLLADSGGANLVVDTLLGQVSPRLLPWAMALVAVIIGLPMFFETASCCCCPSSSWSPSAPAGGSCGWRFQPSPASQSCTGCGPAASGAACRHRQPNAPLGITLALGLLVAIPTVIICGPLFSTLAARWVPVDAPKLAGGVDTEHTQADPDAKRQPTFLVTLLTIVFPVVLMLLKAIVDIFDPDAKNPSGVRVFFDFIGEPLVAMTLAVLLAIVTFGYAVGFNGGKSAARSALQWAPSRQ